MYKEEEWNPKAKFNFGPTWLNGSTISTSALQIAQKPDLSVLNRVRYYYTSNLFLIKM